MIAKRYQPYWEAKSLSQMDEQEWESICDGCGKCCLQKLQDDETNEIYYTDLACHQLNIKSCQCKVYPDRFKHVDSCVDLTPKHLDVFEWLPDTCSYRVHHETGALPDWHPLLVGDNSQMIRQGLTVKDYAINEKRVPEEDWETHVIRWVHGIPEHIDLG
jgi:hypothetical protein